MEPIRVLQVVGKMHYGGMETLIMNVYRKIDRSKVQFDFMVHYREPGAYDDEIRRLGGNIYVMPSTVPQNYFKYKKALKQFFIQHPEYKIIHGHLHSTAFLYHKMAKKYGKANCCITHAHNDGYDHNLKGEIAYRTSLWAQKRTDVFFGCSEAACAFFFPQAIKTRPMTIIKNGIDSEKYIYNPHIRDTVREELGIKNQFVVGHVGRFFPQKNHEYLLQIFQAVCVKMPNSRLLLVGDGYLKEVIEKKCAAMGLKEQVLFLGTRPDVNRILQAADVFVLPSLYEGLGIVLIEAQAAGLPSFTSADVVPQDAKVSQLLQYIPLEEPPAVWSERICKAFPHERSSPIDAIKEHGFDIQTTADYLQDFYLNHDS